MSASICLLYGTDEELQTALPEWRKPKSKPIPVDSVLTNPFTGETRPFTRYEYEEPFDPGHEGLGIPDWDDIRPLSIAGDYDIPFFLAETCGWEGPPILCAPPEMAEAMLTEVSPARVEELISGKLEQRIQEEEECLFENIAELLRDIREGVTAAQKEGGRFAVYY